MSDALALKRSSPLANSAHRAIRWRRPSDHARHPKLQELTISRLLAALDKVTSHRTLPDCPLWEQLGRALQVFVNDADDAPDDSAGRAGAKPRDRQRALRRDGGANLITTLCVLIWNADFSTSRSNGYIGTPIGGGRWEPHTWERLFEFGFGQQVTGELSLARVERWTRVLAKAGILKTHRRWDRYEKKNGDEGFEALPSIKILTPEIFKLCGTFGVYRALRREQKQDEEAAQHRTRLARMGKLVEMDVHKKTRESKQDPRTQAEAIQRHQDTATGPPPITEVTDAATSIAKLKKRFGMTPKDAP